MCIARVRQTFELPLVTEALHVPQTLSIASEAIPLILGRPALHPVRLAGHEGMSSLFTYELLLKTPDSLNLMYSASAFQPGGWYSISRYAALSAVL